MTKKNRGDVSQQMTCFNYLHRQIKTANFIAKVNYWQALFVFVWYTSEFTRFLDFFRRRSLQYGNHNFTGKWTFRCRGGKLTSARCMAGACGVTMFAILVVRERGEAWILLRKGILLLGWKAVWCFFIAKMLEAYFKFRHWLWNASTEWFF